LERVLDEIVIDRPKGRQHLCADKGYSGDPAQQAIKERKYIPHVKQRGQEIQEKKTNPRFKARRWVVEVTHSWFNRFRKLLVIREVHRDLRSAFTNGRSHDRLQKSRLYLRIGS